MKQRINTLSPLLAGFALAMSLAVCRGTVVLDATFSQAPGTPIIGSSPDIGGAWTGNAGNPAITISAENSCDTSGTGGVGLFSTFTSTLGAGQVLTLSYDTLAPASGTSFNGWWGVSLFAGGNEDIFTGKPGSLAELGVDGSAPGTHGDGDTSIVNHITFTYAYDTGAYTFTTANGTLSGNATPSLPLDNLRVANGGDNGDINLDNLVVDISAAPVFNFHSQVPGVGSYGVLTTNVISVQTTDGLYPVNTNTVAMQLDGSAVAPSISKPNNITTISYIPTLPLSAGSLHTVVVTLADSGGTWHTNTWSFTTVFASTLPITWAGPFIANGADVTIFTTNDAWLGTNYEGGANETVYFRFSEDFINTNAGGTWGGFEFYQDGSERFLVGKAGSSPNWSVAAGVPDTDVPPVTSIATNEWHTFLVRADYSAGGANTAVEVWLDPDFTKGEVDQPTAPLQLSFNNTFDQIRLRAGWTPTTIQYSNIMVAATPEGVGLPRNAEATFQNFTPGQNAASAAISTPIGATVMLGSYGISTNAVTMTLDGNSVNPTFAVTTNSIAVSYQPPTPLAAGSTHTVAVSATDSTGTAYATSWSFTVDQYPTLPVTQAGPLDAFTGSDIILYNSQNEWIGGNYGTSSSNTLYTTFSMSFFSLNGETGSGGGFGGLHFFQNSTEVLLIGNNWSSTNWSVDAAGTGFDLVPTVPIVLFDWHTLVVRMNFVPGTNAQVKIWFDPDFTKTEGNQPVPPTTFNANCCFNNIHLRAGNGSAHTEFTNIVMSATSPFAAPVTAGILSLANSGSNLQLSWTGTGTLQVAPTVAGPWADAASQGNPQAVTATNSAAFYRLRQ